MLNAGRLYLGSSDLAGKVFVTSGLGGMSGAQAKAAVISGCVGVVAEVSECINIVTTNLWSKQWLFLVCGKGINVLNTHN